MDTGEDIHPHESVLTVASSSSKSLVVFGLWHVMEKDYQILDQISKKGPINHIKNGGSTFRMLKQNWQEMRTNILLCH